MIDQQPVFDSDLAAEACQSKACQEALQPPRPSVERAAKSSSDGAQNLVQGWRKAIYFSVGALFFTVGVLGIILPGLPATPFFLLTSFFLIRSSPRLNNMLLRSRLFGPVLVDWQKHGGIRTHIRIKAISAVVIAVALTIWFSGFAFWPAVVVTLMATVGVVVILRLPPARAV